MGSQLKQVVSAMARKSWRNKKHRSVLARVGWTFSAVANAVASGTSSAHWHAFLKTPNPAAGICCFLSPVPFTAEALIQIPLK